MGSKMRVFLFQTAKGLHASSGGYKANLSVLQHLASLGHATAQMCFAHKKEVQSYCAEMEAEGLRTALTSSKLQMPMDDGLCMEVATHVFVNKDGIRVVAIDLDGFEKAFPEKDQTTEITEFVAKSKTSSRLYAYILFMSMHLYVFRPTHVIFNNALGLKATSIMPFLKNACRVCVVHMAEQLPFGPFAGGLTGGACSPAEHGLLQEVDAIWSVSKAIENYTSVYGQLDTTFNNLHPWIYLDSRTRALPPQRWNWKQDYVGIINPSPIKGSPIFCQLARRCPQFKFAAWCSWGTNERVRKELEELPNIDVLPTCRDMEEAWKKIKVLLVPSLWYEAWGIVVVEAQLRGIPVISSNMGGIPEAKLGLPYILPVNGLTGERNGVNDYVVPDQDVELWHVVLEKLMTDRDRYERLSNRVRNETVRWLKGLDERAIEKWLMNMEKTE